MNEDTQLDKDARQAYFETMELLKQKNDVRRHEIIGAVDELPYDRAVMIALIDLCLRVGKQDALNTVVTQTFNAIRQNGFQIDAENWCVKV